MEGRSNILYTFEAPIDALSHATLHKMRNLDYTENHRITLGCLGDAALNKYLEDRPGIRNIVLCLDNDRWGREASDKLMKQYIEKGYAMSQEFPNCKDYNEDLVELVKSKALSRIR
jgi:hypothetical protein